MKTLSAKSIHVTGLVQGVGFRPFIYRLAMKYGVFGWVENGNDGVRIHVEGPSQKILIFIRDISEQAPPASLVQDVFVNEDRWQNYKDFQIKKSADYSEHITDISPDIAVCPECLADMKSQKNRINYPFINCTNCGPRFSIITNLPYDRAMTTMHNFQMCPECSDEYNNVRDRRFHAQPIACHHCGPEYELITKTSSIKGIDSICKKAAELITAGRTIAIKGLGGFHLACDATSEKAVRRLRERKIREGKPFAVMFKNLAEVVRFMEVSQEERKALESWQRPIVILKNKRNLNQLAPGVSNGFDSTGVMLPYMPVHYLLFEKLAMPAIVLTSGNLSDEPVMIGNSEAKKCLNQIADAFLVYNRDIYNRTDDSVLMVTGDVPRLIRRSRGFAPAPLNLDIHCDGIFAAGAELVNCFCLGKENKAIMSQHIGDLKNLETLEFYVESLNRHLSMFRVKPGLVVCDLHPDYLSTTFAEEFALKNGTIPLVKIQHHHAHIAACMAENKLDEKVIGISMDGVGYGTDGHIWGFEVLVCDLTGFDRKIHLEYVQQPGGDHANKEPWRMAVAYLYKYITEDIDSLYLPFLQNIGPEKIHLIKTALKNNINTPLTSSAGRLFDAVAALTGLCNFSSFHAEAPMRLENMIDHAETGHYDYSMGATINPGPMIKGILNDIKLNIPVRNISTKFHNTMVQIILEAANRLRDETGITKIVLSGGTFQNRHLLSECENKLQYFNFEVFTHRQFPSNDGALALGQLVIAAKRREAGLIGLDPYN